MREIVLADFSEFTCIRAVAGRRKEESRLVEEGTSATAKGQRRWRVRQPEVHETARDVARTVDLGSSQDDAVEAQSTSGSAAGR